MKILYCRSIWWPFGSHLTCTMQRKLYCDMHGYKLLYTYNNHPAYSLYEGRISRFFPLMSDITDSEIIEFADKKFGAHTNNQRMFLLEFTDNKQFLKDTEICLRKDITQTPFHEYKPECFVTFEDYRASIMKNLAEPSNEIKEYLQTIPFIQEVEKLNGDYIAVHIRWTDKTKGTFAEADFYDVDVYFNHALDLREKHGTNNIVLNCDNTDAVTKFLEYNDTNKLNFNIIYDKEENRPKNEWKECVFQKWVNKDRFKSRDNEEVDKHMYVNDILNGFKIYKVIFEADSVICDYFSNMAFAPCVARNNKKDINISNKPPFILFPGSKFWPKHTFSKNVLDQRKGVEYV